VGGTGVGGIRVGVGVGLAHPATKAINKTRGTICMTRFIRLSSFGSDLQPDIGEPRLS
jgi:hypothetical protein